MSKKVDDIEKNVHGFDHVVYSMGEVKKTPGGDIFDASGDMKYLLQYIRMMSEALKLKDVQIEDLQNQLDVLRKRKTK